MIRLFALGVALFLASCSSTPSREVASGEARIVSISPAMTESLFALGAGEHVVGVSRYCDYPEAATRLPRVGGFLDPSLESILALRPTLVVGHRSPSNRGVVLALTNAGITTYFPEGERLASISQTLRKLGDHTQTRTQASALVERIDADLSAISAKAEDLSHPRVLLLYGLRPLTGAGPNTFADELLHIAGARNVLERAAPYSTIGDEQLIALSPDVIVISDMGEGSLDMLYAERFATVPAVKNRRIVRVNDPRVMRPGPRIAEGARILAMAIHPGVRFE